MRSNYCLFILLVILVSAEIAFGQIANSELAAENRGFGKTGLINAADYGYISEASDIENAKPLQKAADQTGTIVVSRPGIYKMAGSILLRLSLMVLFINR